MRHLIALRTAIFELTLACPLRCIACGSSAGKARPNELNCAEWLSVLEDIVALGCRRLTLSGGDPLLHESWADIVAAARARGVMTEMITSGVGIDERLAKEIRRAGLASITVSVDGRGEDHDFLRGARGGYGQVLETIRLLDAAGVRVGVSTQVNRRTIDSLDELGDDLERAGAIGWQLQLTMPLGRASAVADELVFEPCEMPGVHQVLRQLVRRPRLRPSITDNIGYLTEDDVLLRTPYRFATRVWTGCFAGVRTVAVTSDGGVKACLSLPDSFIEGSVREESLRQIWESPDRFAWNRDFDLTALDEDCAACPQARLCRGGCSALSVAATGSPHRGPYCFRKFES